MNTNTNYKPITCPICGSKEIAFIPEFHKCILLRIIRTVLIIALITISIFYLPHIFANKTNQTLIIIEIVVLLVFLGIDALIKINEEKSHIKGICRNCGNIWLID